MKFDYKVVYDNNEDSKYLPKDRFYIRLEYANNGGNIKRDQLIKISFQKSSVYRYVSLKSNPNNLQVYIDYDLKLKLGLVEDFGEIIISKPSILEKYFIAPFKFFKNYNSLYLIATFFISLISLILTIAQYFFS
jgi:hypothetical protein